MYANAKNPGVSLSPADRDSIFERIIIREEILSKDRAFQCHQPTERELFFFLLEDKETKLGTAVPKESCIQGHAFGDFVLSSSLLDSSDFSGR
ncbi:hypothetical protein KM043_004734 [Ampulex compressa]|nr:hypothetical protein KM043_004734 [Ampulex compressa]